MIKARLLALALFPCFFLTACGGGDVASQSKALMGRIADVLESIDDKESLEAAKPKFAAVVEDMKGLKKKVDAMTAEEKAEMKTELEKEAAPMQARMAKAMEGKSPELMMEIGKLMATMPDMGN